MVSRQYCLAVFTNLWLNYKLCYLMEKYSLKQEETVHGFLSDHLGQCFSACVNQRATQPLKAKQKPYQAVVSL